ncbi:MAG: alpha/beta hydrolase [Myxococcales bacterium]|nr:alpha/beta hydrolase [Myxococcales bacterium]
MSEHTLQRVAGPASSPAARAVGLGLQGLAALSTPATSYAAEWLFLRPVNQVAPPERERGVRRQATRFPIPWDLGSLQGYRWGEPSDPVVLVVHGWAGRSSQFAAFVRPLLMAGFQVVAFDAPGHGRSCSVPLPLPRYADAIGAAVRAVGPVEGVVAHSFGASAMAYALSSGLSVRRAVFVAPMDPGTAAGRFCGLLGLPQRVRIDMERRLELRFGVPLEHFRASMVGARGEVPLLVVHDSDDRVVPSGDGEAWARAWPGATLWVTQGLGHGRILWDRDVIDRAVGFLKTRA